MYMGGNNNAASSGVLKSLDGGMHWTKVSAGITDTRLLGLFIVDDAADHVLAGTPSGVFETLNGGTSWAYAPQTSHWGVASGFTNGTINGKPYILVGNEAGIGNVPLTPGVSVVNASWSLIPPPPGHAAFRTNKITSSEVRNGKPLANSVVGGCIWPDHSHGVFHIATIVNTTYADWSFQLDQPCISLALDPNDADHLIVNNSSNPSGAHVYESTDGGKTFHGCLNERGAYQTAIDRRGWMYHSSGVGASRNIGGCTNGKWEPYFVRRTWRRTGQVVDRTSHDFQQINIDFGSTVAFDPTKGCSSSTAPSSR